MNSKRMAECASCGKKFRTRRAGIVYCSKECGENGSPYKESVCVVCSKTYKKMSSRQIYCSKECRETVQISRAKGELKECLVCGGEFVSTKENIKICSDECRKERLKQQNAIAGIKYRSRKPKKKKEKKTVKRKVKKENRDLNILRHCAHCGNKFVSKSTNGKYCSKQCSSDFHNKKKCKNKKVKEYGVFPKTLRYENIGVL